MSEPKLSSTLGRGLSDLMQDVSPTRTLIRSSEHGFVQLPLAEIHLPGGEPEPPVDSALLDSVRRVGVVQPVLVRKAERGYTLVAGRRRLRAARAAGLDRLPARVLGSGEERDGDYREADNFARETASDKSPYVAIAVRAIKTPAIAAALLLGLMGGWLLGTLHLRELGVGRSVSGPADRAPAPIEDAEMGVPLRWSF